MAAAQKSFNLKSLLGLSGYPTPIISDELPTFPANYSRVKNKLLFNEDKLGHNGLKLCKNITSLYINCKVIILIDTTTTEYYNRKTGKLGTSTYAIPFIFTDKLENNITLKTTTKLYTITQNRDSSNKYTHICDEDSIFMVNVDTLQQFAVEKKLYYQPLSEQPALAPVQLNGPQNNNRAAAIVPPNQPNNDIYEIIHQLFKAKIPLVDGKIHTITMMYKDKEKKNMIQLKFDSYNGTLTPNELYNKNKIEDVFKQSFNRDGEEYRIETITKTPEGLNITFKSVNKNSTSGLFGAFQKSKRYSELIPLQQDGGHRKTRHNKKTKRSKKVHHRTYRNTKRHRK
jgi:hypothetical protein